MGFGTHASAVADVIKNAAPNGNAVALAVDAARLYDALDGHDTELDDTSRGLVLMRKSDTAATWEMVGDPSGTLVVASAATKSAARLLEETDAGKKIVDFDDHLDDPARDWRNPGVDGMLAK